jgi:hypothetical protein
MNNSSSLTGNFSTLPTPTQPPPWMPSPSPEALMGNQFFSSFMLLVAAMLIVIAAFVFIRGHILKERVYKIGGLAFILLAAACISISFTQEGNILIPFVTGGGFLIAFFIIVFTNSSKILEASAREINVVYTETELAKPIKISDIIIWGGWFKIVKQWGHRKAMLFYALLNISCLLLIPLSLWIFNILPTIFTAVLAIVLIVGVLIFALPIFYRTVVINMATSNDDNCSSDST